jgi:hypothetical protein
LTGRPGRPKKTTGRQARPRKWMTGTGRLYRCTACHRQARPTFLGLFHPLVQTMNLSFRSVVFFSLKYLFRQSREGLIYTFIFFFLSVRSTLFTSTIDNKLLCHTWPSYVGTYDYSSYRYAWQVDMCHLIEDLISYKNI